MTPSPLQLKSYFFTKVLVELAKPFEDPESTDVKATDFNFNGVNIGTEIGVAVAEHQTDSPTDFMVELKISILNKDGASCPYKIDVAIIGIFDISEKIDKEKRENIVTVNGVSILFGCVREMVASITSRSMHGMLILPTANFTDHVQANKSKTLKKRAGRANKA